MRLELKREATATMTADTTVSRICLQDDWSTDGNDVEQTVAAAVDTGESDEQQLTGGHRVPPNMGYSV